MKTKQLNKGCNVEICSSKRKQAVLNKLTIKYLTVWPLGYVPNNTATHLLKLRIHGRERCFPIFSPKIDYVVKVAGK